MRAMLIDENKNFIWSEVDNPVIKDNEVLVEIYAAALNRADLMQRNGEYPSPPGCPEWMGLEVSGIIADIGSEAKEKSRWKIGDKVCTLLGGGGYAEYVTVPYDMLMPIPSNFTMEEAAAIPEAYATAYLNLFIEGNLKKGETVLIHAGASGVGIAATQIASAYGAKVIVTVRSDEKVKTIEPYGSDLIVNSKTQDIAQVFECHPVDVVIDCVGGLDMGNCFSKINRYGRWIVIATLGGDLSNINLKILYQKGLRLIGSTLRSRSPQMKSKIISELVTNVFPYLESGMFKPVIYKILDIKDVDKAHGILEKNQNIGKVILKIQGK